MSDHRSQRRKAIRIADIAREIDISTGTVSMALAGSPRVSPDTRKRVLQACRTLGYRPPRSKQSKGPAVSVGFVSIGNPIGCPINAGLAHHLRALAQLRGVNLEMTAIESADPASAAERTIAFAKSRDTLLISGTMPPQLVHKLAQAEVTFASLDLPAHSDRHPAAFPGVAIISDDREMAMLATRTLIARGHKRIAFITETTQPHRSHARWLDGYRLALLDAGLPIDRTLIGDIGLDHAGLPAFAQRIAASQRPPTAAVVTDLPAINPLIAELRAHNIEIDQRNLIAWGTPELAPLYRLQSQPMIGINVQQWAETALRYAASPHEARIRPGSIIFVPHHAWNLDADSLDEDSLDEDSRAN